jgi:ATP-dependent DNA ligase
VNLPEIEAPWAEINSTVSMSAGQPGSLPPGLPASGQGGGADLVSALRLVPRSSFIPPRMPALLARLLREGGWLYEVKFGGYRMQVSKTAAAIKGHFRQTY